MVLNLAKFSTAVPDQNLTDLGHGLHRIHVALFELCMRQLLVKNLHPVLNLVPDSLTIFGKDRVVTTQVYLSIGRRYPDKRAIHVLGVTAVIPMVIPPRRNFSTTTIYYHY